MACKGGTVMGGYECFHCGAEIEYRIPIPDKEYKKNAELQTNDEKHL
jgi:hypothetical protein